MTDDAKRQAQALFAELLECEDSGERWRRAENQCAAQPEVLAAFRALEVAWQKAQAARLLETPLPDLLTEWDDDGDWQLQPGDVIGKYVIEAAVGRGGMGEVYRGRQLDLDRLVALKLAPAFFIDRSRIEAQALAQAQHPNVVQIIEIATHGDYIVLVLEWIDGGTLATDPAGGRTPRQTAEIVAKLARAVQYLHDRNIIHRDLKPANVLRTSDGTLKLADFGLAKKLDSAAGGTKVGDVMGTPSYMAPEQVDGDPATIGRAADVYALGAILYDLLTGRPPFTGDTAARVFESVRHDEPVPPRRLKPEIPNDLNTICLKCLEKNPERRYESAQALAGDLQRFLDGYAIQARPVSAPERLWRWCRRRPAVATLSAALILLGVGSALAGGILWQQRRAQEQHKQRVVDLMLGQLKEFDRLVERQRLQVGVQLKNSDEMLRAIDARQEELIREIGDSPETQFARAYRLHLASQTHLDRGDTRAALETAQQALAAFEILAAATPDRIDYQAGLARSRMRVAAALGARGQLRQALQEYSEALTIWDRLANKHPDQLAYLFDKANTHDARAIVLAVQRDDQRSAAEFEQAASARNQLFERGGREPLWQCRLAESKYRSAQRQQNDNPLAALGAVRSARRIAEEIVQAHGDLAESHSVLLRTLLLEGELCQELGRRDQALAAFQRALSLTERFTIIDPDHQFWKLQHLHIQFSIGNLATREDFDAELRRQIALLQQQIAVHAAQLQRDPEQFGHQMGQIAKRAQLCDLRPLLKARQEFRPGQNFMLKYVLSHRGEKEQLEQIVRDYDALLERDPTNAAVVWGKALAQFSLMKTLPPLNRKALQEAERKACQIPVDFYRRRMKDEPDHPTWRYYLAKCVLQVGNSQARADQLKAARDSFTEALQLLEPLTNREDAVPEWRGEAAKACGELSRLSLLDKKPDASVQWSERARQHLEQLVARFPQNVKWRKKLAQQYKDHANSLSARNQLAEARRFFGMYLDGLEQAATLLPEDPLRSPPDIESSLMLRVLEEMNRPNMLDTIRTQIKLHETSPESDAKNHHTPEVIGAYAELVRWLDPGQPDQAAELQRALTRGLELLQAERKTGRLHPYHARLIPAFESRLKESPPTK